LEEKVFQFFFRGTKVRNASPFGPMTPPFSKELKIYIFHFWEMLCEAKSKTLAPPLKKVEGKK
jgi:hypothetical protein